MGLHIEGERAFEATQCSLEDSLSQKVVQDHLSAEFHVVVKFLYEGTILNHQLEEELSLLIVAYLYEKLFHCQSILYGQHNIFSILHAISFVRFSLSKTKFT
jgi:hypothetical protein